MKTKRKRGRPRTGRVRIDTTLKQSTMNMLGELQKEYKYQGRVIDKAVKNLYNKIREQRGL